VWAARSASRARESWMAPPGGVAVRQRGKRVLDLAIAVPLTIVSLPVMLAVAAAIRLDTPGPALFRQTRVGRDGRLFDMWKFRSMYLGAPDTVHRAGAVAWFSGALSPTGYKLVDDPRVTRVGRLVRRTSLDELPQLFNVLRGDMSLVGPRPAIPYELEFYAPWHHQRQMTLPGMTGLWQVRGRDRLSAGMMMELDARYVREWSLALDLRILLQTLPALFGRYARS
jgi:lipopolysaccharide/colanic/teichoic acid biosynthesis glycosyltransferase